MLIVSSIRFLIFQVEGKYNLTNQAVYLKTMERVPSLVIEWDLRSRGLFEIENACMAYLLAPLFVSLPQRLFVG